MLKPPPPRPRQKSSDDLSSVSRLDLAEEQSREALRLHQQEKARNEALQRKLDEALAAAAAPRSEKPSISPTGALTVHGKGWKVAVPLGLIASLALPVWTVVSDYLRMKREFAEQTKLLGTYEARFEKQAAEIAKAKEDTTSLRTTVAELSGYLAGVLPKAGVKVPGAEPGAILMNVESDPLPRGVRRPPPVNVKTRVPAPEPTR